ARGTMLSISPRLLTFFVAPILGEDADHLKSVFGGISVRYDKTFNESNVPVSDDVQRLRTDPTWGQSVSDVITPTRLPDNTLRIGGFLFFEEKFGPSTLQISGGPSVGITFLPALTEIDCFQVDFQQ